MTFPLTPIIDTFDQPDTTVASAPPAGVFQGVGNTPLIDDFDRPDENPITDGIWLPNTYGSPPPYEQIKIVNGVAVPNTAAAGAYIPAIEGGDQEAWATIAALPTGAEFFILSIRDHATTAVEPSLGVLVRQDGSCEIVKSDVDPNNFTQVGNQPAGTLVVGDRIGIRLEGNVVKMWRRRAGQNNVLAQTIWEGIVDGGFPSIYFSGLSGGISDFGGGYIGLPGWWPWGVQNAGAGVREGVIVGLPFSYSSMFAARGPEDPNLLPTYSLGQFEIYCDIEYDPAPGLFDENGEPIAGGIADIELWLDTTPKHTPHGKYVGLWQTSQDYVFFDFGHLDANGLYVDDSFDVTFPAAVSLARGDGIGVRGNEIGWSMWHRPGRNGTWVQIYMLTWAEVDQVLAAAGETSTSAEWRTATAPLEIGVNYSNSVASGLKNVGGGVLPIVGNQIVYLDFFPPQEEDIVTLHVEEAPTSTGPWVEIQTFPAGPYPDYISNVTITQAFEKNDWFRIRWENSEGAFTPYSEPLQGGTTTLVATIVDRMMLRDVAIDENIAAQEAEAAISEYFRVTNPYDVDPTNIAPNIIMGIMLLAMSRVYLVESAISEAGSYTAGIIGQTYKGHQGKDIDAIIKLANRYLNRNYSAIMLLKEIAVGGGYKQIVAADVTRSIIEIQ